MSSDSDPFRALGLEPTVDLDPAELDRRQRELTLERRAQGPLALEMLNQAVRLLKDPVSRAEQVFLRLGLPVRSAPSELLLERVFAEREQIEAWRRGNELGALQHWLQDEALPRQRELIAALTALLNASACIPPEQARVPLATDLASSCRDSSAVLEGRVAAAKVCPDFRRAALGLLDELRYGARSIAAARLAIDAAEG